MTSYEEISEHHEEIKQMFNEGTPRAKIAIVLDIPEHRLRQYMIMQGWYKDPVLQSKEELVKILEQSGYNNMAAAKLVGCSEYTIRERRIKYNV